MGHPFAKRHGQPLLDPGVINVITGEFRNAWTIVAPALAGSDIVGELRNDSWVAQYLQPGTQLMFNRPIDDKIATEIDAYRLAQIASATNRLFRKWR